jgi:hypothetical protein
MTYAEKLRNPRWQKKRLEIMQRDDFTCRLCGDKESTLHVHHKEYFNGREPWEYDEENFVTYCYVCHKVVEDINGTVKVIDFVSAKKMYNDSGSLHSIMVSFVHDFLVYVAAYIYEANSQGIKHIATIGSETIDVIHDLRQQAELTTLR